MARRGWTDLTFHSLRKIGTGRLSKKLPNVIELSHITGHSDLQTLARRYYGLDLDVLLRKIDNAAAQRQPEISDDFLEKLKAEIRAEIEAEMKAKGNVVVQ